MEVEVDLQERFKLLCNQWETTDDVYGELTCFVIRLCMGDHKYGPTLRAEYTNDSLDDGPKLHGSPPRHIRRFFVNTGA